MLKHAQGPRPVVDDLDQLEQQRHKARKKRSLRDLFRKTEENRIYRELWRHVRPHRRALFVGIGLAFMASAAGVGNIFILEKVFEPILMGDTTRGPVATMLALSAKTNAMGGSLDAWWTTLAALSSTAWGMLTRPGKLNVAVAAFMLLVFFEQATKYHQKLINRTVALELVRSVRASLFDKLMDLSMRFFQKNPSGKLMSRVTSDLNQLGSILVDVMVVYLTDALTVVMMLAYLGAKGGTAVLAGLSIGIVSFLPVQRLARRVRRKEHDNQKKMGGVFQRLAEVLSAQKVVKAFAAEEFERQHFGQLNTAYTEGRKKTMQLRARTGPVVEIAGAAGVAFLVWWGGMQVIDGSWQATGFMAIIFILVRLVGSLRRLGETSTKIQTGLAAADRVGTILYQQSEVVEAPDATPLPGVEQGISFRGVCFSYDADHPVLDDISFDLPRGKTLAIVGPTGSC